jgi:hypothetical protein
MEEFEQSTSFRVRELSFPVIIEMDHEVLISTTIPNTFFCNLSSFLSIL